MLKNESQELLEIENRRLSQQIKELRECQTQICRMLNSKGAPDGDLLFKLKFILNLIDW